MKKMKFSTITIRVMSMLAIASMFILAGCGDDDDGGTPAPTQNIWEIVQDRSELSGLEAELAAAGLDNALATTNNITLFAPSNQALNTLLNTLGIDDFSPIREDVVNAVLTYHVATSVVLASDLTAGSTIATLQGEEIDVIGGPALSTGATSDSEVVTADILASNGAVHVVDVVLVPPTVGDLIVSTLGTLAQPILLSADFSILADGIRKADAEYADPENGIPTLVSILADLEESPLQGTDFTVFAPNNAVFNTAGITVESLTAEQWYGTIAKHVGIGIFLPADLNTGVVINTAAGEGTEINVTNAGEGGNFTSIFLNNDEDPDFEAEVAAPSVATASNGVIHAIAGIL